MLKTGKPYWTAFYTKPRNERKAAERLAAKGFSIYCPCQTVLKQWSDRKKKVTEPVFTSYLFAKVDEQARQEILKDLGIVSNVYWLGKPVVIREEEILAIKNFLNDYDAVAINSAQFKEGTAVDIEAGPFSGQSGEIISIQGKRAYLTIASLGVVLQAEIGLHHLSPKKHTFSSIKSTTFYP